MLIFRAWATCARAKGHLINRKRREIFRLLRRGGAAEVILDIRLSRLLSAMDLAENMLFYAFNLTPHHFLLSDQKSKILKTTKFIQLEY